VSRPAAPFPPPDPASLGRSNTVATPTRLDRLHSGVAAARAKGNEMLDQLEAARPRHRTIDVAFVSIERDTAAAGSVLAAAVAFRIFLFLVPYVFVLVYGFGLFSSATGSDPRDVAAKAGIVGLLASTIDVAADQSLVTRITVFVVALYALFSTSRTLLKVLAVVHALAWQLRPPRRLKLTKPALLLIVLVTAAIALVQLINWMRDRSFIAGLSAEILFIAVPAGAWLVVSLRFFVHPPEAGWRDLLPGALLVGVGVQVLHFVTVYWITHLLSSKSETYGAIGAALAILFWAYLLGRILAASAVLNAGAWQQRHAPKRPLPPPPTRAG
jgi:uncharacterized BrkB/YihY/UPF0761 family membrane protein